MSEIKPCPFCGEDEIVCYQGNKAIGTPNALYWYKIVCMKCFCQTGERSENLTDVKKLLAEDWNTRPIEDALNQRIKELENELKAEKIRFQLLAETIRAVVK